MRHGIEWWENFWKWLRGESEQIKLPMSGAPTLKKHLEKKYKQFEELWSKGDIKREAK